MWNEFVLFGRTKEDVYKRQVHSGPPMLMTRNLLYTAVTRAKTLVVLVGIQETISAMVNNDREVGRYTGLAQRIRNLYDFMAEAGE